MKQNDCIIVTGAGGLVGSAVVEYLRSQMYTCVVGLTRKDCDLTDVKATARLFDQIGPTYVFHAAARVYGLGGNMANQGKSIFENTLINTSVVYASALVADVKKIVVMGSNAAYPWPTPLPFKEENIYNGRPHEGEVGYGHAKRHMLSMLEVCGDSYGLDWVYLVSGNLYGPRDRFDPVSGHVIPTLIHKFYEALIDDDKLIEVWGDGTPERDFLYVKDLARLVHRVLDDDVRGVLNVGRTDRGSQIMDIVNILCRITGVSERRIRWDTDKPNGRLNCYADLTRLRALGFGPTYSLEVGLQETWDWYKARRKENQEYQIGWTDQCR